VQDRQPGKEGQSMGPFDIKRDDQGWTIYDVSTEEPVTVEGVEQVGLPLDDADDLADLLNIAWGRQSETVH
jgi:hypothetical protein